MSKELKHALEVILKPGFGQTERPMKPTLTELLGVDSAELIINALQQAKLQAEADEMDAYRWRGVFIEGSDQWNHYDHAATHFAQRAEDISNLIARVAE